jgi:hypothetical protein
VRAPRSIPADSGIIFSVPLFFVSEIEVAIHAITKVYQLRFRLTLVNNKIIKINDIFKGFLGQLNKSLGETFYL